MALSTAGNSILFLLLLSGFLPHLFGASLLPELVSDGEYCHIDAIYSLGDSVTDTGNGILELPLPCAHLPYGETLGKPTGRSSDGLLLIDYLAKALKLPLLPPYLDEDADFTHGVNFAVAGATALDPNFFAKRGLRIPGTKSSLDVQLNWFHKHVRSICSSDTKCAAEEKLGKALVLLGQIGGNDYQAPLRSGKGIEDMISLIPKVVQKISNAVKGVIEAGAVQIIVPAMFPLGCLPTYLATFNITDDAEAYDHRKCLKILNNVSSIQNKQLQAALDMLRMEYPHALIMYADYYNALLYLLDNAATLGFDESSLLKACCGGGGGEYNYDIKKQCGFPAGVACRNPEQYVSWDGSHMTQQAYKIMAAKLIYGGYTYPNLPCMTTPLATNE